MKNGITIYTDGSSRGNPGPGGWAAIIITSKNVVELVGKKNPATNNQMELMAVEASLQYVLEQDSGAYITLHADSTYVLHGIATWLDGWVRKGWITMAKKPVENKLQWQKLLMLRDAFGKRLELIKVSGHSGHKYNDRCDELAVAAALGKSPKPFFGTVKEYEVFLTQNPPKSEKKPDKKIAPKGAAYSYVSLVDGKVYVDKTWAACEQRVKGKKSPSYKKVFSKKEETDVVQEYTLKTLV